MTTYIIYAQKYSEVAMKKYGDPYVWIPVKRIRQRPPSSETEFHRWLWSLVKKFGAGIYRINRTQNFGERKGFHPVFMGYVDEHYIHIDRRYGEYKGIPGLPSSRDLYYKRKPVENRQRFRKRGKRRF